VIKTSRSRFKSTDKLFESCLVIEIFLEFLIVGFGKFEFVKTKYGIDFPSSFGPSKLFRCGRFGVTDEFWKGHWTVIGIADLDESRLVIDHLFASPFSGLVKKTLRALLVSPGFTTAKKRALVKPGAEKKQSKRRGVKGTWNTADRNGRGYAAKAP
jgi:hypothetical protein